MKLIISGGGTGGHFFPALDILKRAKDRKVKTLYVGTERGIEKKFESSIPGEKLFLETYPLRRVPLKERVRAVKSFILGVPRLRSEIEGDFSSLIFGGYSSVPVGIFTLLRRKNLFIHEQNSVPSMTNRTFSLFARKIFITFEYTRKFLKGDHVIKTGLPVREELLSARMEKRNAKETLGFDPSSPLILFMGGSQGARFINSLAVDFARKTGVQTILLSGEKDFERISQLAKGVKNFKVFPFRTDMGLIYSASDVAVCRSGAGTVTELSLFKVPAVFIPYPFAAGDHQYYNAKEIEELGGAFVIRQEDVNPEKVIGLVDRVIVNIEIMKESVGKFANPEASRIILDEVLKD